MLKTRELLVVYMKRKLLIVALALGGVIAITKAWINTEVRRVQWAIELAGGMGTLTAKGGKPITEQERLFLKSVRIAFDAETVKEIDQLRLCVEENEDCSTRLFTVINVALLQTKDFSKVEQLVYQYKNATLRKPVDCEARYEISRTILASRHALSLPEKTAMESARGMLEKIQANGGVDYSLNTSSCKYYFANHPAVAKAYLAHLAFLMSIEKGNISPGWVYLIAVPGVKSLLDDGATK